MLIFRGVGGGFKVVYGPYFKQGGAPDPVVNGAITRIWVVVSNIFCFHPDPWGNDPMSLILFRWVETTN